MVNLIGEAKVIDLIFTSRLIEADEALHIGLVNELCDDCDATMERALAIATRLKQHAPLTMRSIKTILRRLREAQPKVEDADLIGEVYGSDDFREGMESFLAKRRPNWKGR